MNKVLVIFILTTLSGLSTLIGYFLIFFKIKKEKIMSFSLSFASGVMFTISIIDLIPSAYNYLNIYNFIFRLLIIIFFFIIGVILSTFISSKFDKNKDNSLKKVGIISMIAIIFHNIPEGIITFMISGILMIISLFFKPIYTAVALLVVIFLSIIITIYAFILAKNNKKQR